MSPGSEPAIRDCGGELAAFALGSLEPGEAVRFARHLESCAVCRDELIALEGVASALAMSVTPRPAPVDLRADVMRAVAATPKLSHGRARTPRPRRRFAPRQVPRLATAFALVVAAVGGLWLASSSGPGPRVIRAQVTGAGTAQLSVRGGHGQLVVHRFSPPPAGEIYEVWLKRGAAQLAPTNALFSVTAAGDGDVEVPGSLRGVSRVLVTPEPAGGSEVPTHAPVITANLT